MGTFGERLKKIAAECDLNPKEMADVISGGTGKPDEKTVYAYYGNTRTPTFAGLIQIADLFGRSLDWLVGRSDYPVWSDEVRRACQLVKSELDPNDSERAVQDRIIGIIHLLQQHLPQAREGWYLASILNISKSGVSAFMAGEGNLSEGTVPRFCDFMDLNELWLRLGRQEDWKKPSLHNASGWASVVDMYARFGHLPEEHLENGTFFNDCIQRQRRFRP